MKKFVAYYRVSTDQQGRSGLGLEAQQAAVAAYVAGRGTLLASMTEIESGRKKDRPELARALERCRREKATLIIAKLDRLARNVAFIANVLESGVEFVAVDIPQANRLTIHILAAVAEHEREMISERTKAALQAAKARGVRLGNPRPDPAKARAAKAHQAAAYRAGVLPILHALQQQGLGLRASAAELNRRQVPTAQGGRWYASTVRYLLNAEMDSEPRQLTPDSPTL